MDFEIIGFYSLSDFEKLLRIITIESVIDLGNEVLNC
jgi:hypothetical protein